MDRRPATTPRTEQAAISELTLTAGAPLAPPPPPRRRRPWTWAAAALLHMLVIAALLYSYRRPPPQQEALNNTGVSVVFQPGATSSQTPRQAQIPTPAASPPPPPPTPAPNQPQPEVNLNLPQMALAPLPQPTPQPRPQTEARRATRAAPTRHYLVMNNMSFGAPAPPSQAPSKNLDLSLPESDAQAVNTPELQIQGQVGADWEAGFNKWVYAHLYYPDAAAEQGQQGTVTVEFTAHRDGSVTGLHMTDSSGSPFLDQAWEGIFGQNQLPPFPPGGSDTLHITATVHYYIDH